VKLLGRELLGRELGSRAFGLPPRAVALHHLRLLLGTGK